VFDTPGVAPSFRRPVVLVSTCPVATVHGFPGARRENDLTMTTKNTADTSATTPRAPKKASLAQTDVPSMSLIEALRVPKAIASELAKRPSTPLQVAAAMRVKPTTGRFRTMTAAAVAYGLTNGGAFAEKIGLTDLGRRIVAPTVEGDDRAANLEAVLKPRVTREFLTRHDNSKWPRDDIAYNILESMGVPAEQTERALALIRADAESLNLLTKINGTDYVELERDADASALTVDPVEEMAETEAVARTPGPTEPPVIMNENRRVFITHGKNKKIVEQIKKLLKFGDYEAVVSVDNQTTAKPVPDKVMDDMRSCSAGIVHVGSEMKVLDTEGQEHQMVNPNVLIEIGAAMALYNRRFILLVEGGVTLPSNLQGLYEVRYEGDGLDYDSTTRLLEAFADFKNAPTGA
jgi:predicted nucleotide-binding protein